MSGPAITFANVGLTLGRTEILRDVGFEIATGSLHAIEVWEDAITHSLRLAGIRKITTTAKVPQTLRQMSPNLKVIFFIILSLLFIFHSFSDTPC